jgi:hypothetical protein
MAQYLIIFMNGNNMCVRLNLMEMKMNKEISRDIITFGILFAILFTLSLFMGCSKNNNMISDPSVQNTDQSTMQKLLDDDDEFASFEPNYDEQGLMSIALGKINTAIYPLKVGHKVIPVSKDLNVVFTGDTAYGLSTVVYSGTLFIEASYSPVSSNDSVKADTVITKTFTSTITRKVMFLKKTNGNPANEDSANGKWKIAAISLPEGGTVTENINIKKLTVTFPDDSLVITAPNEYFLYRNFAHKKQTPSVSRGEQVKIRVEVTSTYSDTDFVSITYGADKKSFNRSKKILKLVSSSANGSLYDKVYEGTWKANYFTGHTHTVINVMPGQVINQDNTPVECKTWGFPYKIN